MRIRTLLPLFLLFAAIPATAQQTGREEKAARIEQQFREMQQLVSSRNFSVEINRVLPVQGFDVSRFNPEGQIVLEDSTARGRLPYFGRAYRLPYGTEGGLEFDGRMEEPEYQVRTRKGRKWVEFNFRVRSRENDVFDIRIEVFANRNCSVSLNSNNRQQISYSGTVGPREEEEED